MLFPGEMLELRLSQPMISHEKACKQAVSTPMTNMGNYTGGVCSKTKQSLLRRLTSQALKTLYRFRGYPLLAHLRAKNPDGIPIDIAKKLFIRIFCTLGVLPEHLRHLHLGKPELAEIFNSLWREGKLIGAPPDSEPIDWFMLVKDFLMDRFQVDCQMTFEHYI